jgi:DNA-binding Lrp family transcriptional regulator
MKINKINEEDDSRIAGGVELADNYETILATQSEIRNNDKYMKIINILKDKPPMTNKQIAIAYEEIVSTNKRRPKKPDNEVDPASVNQIIIKLKEAGVVIGTGLVSSKAGKSSVNAPGVKGRPKLTNDEIKTLGDGVIRKYLVPLTRQILAQEAVHALPQALHIVLQRRVVEHLLLERVDPVGQRGIFAQPAHVIAQPARIVLPQRMLRLRQHRLQFFQRRAHRHDVQVDDVAQD